MPEMFEWKSDAGDIIRLPRTVKSAILRKNRKLPELELQYVLLEAVCDEEQLAATDALDADEFQAMMALWVRSVLGASLPESSPSPR